MTIGKIVLLGTAAALASCASMNVPASNQGVSVQGAVYRVADGKTATAEASVDKMPGESRPVRIYWFLGDR